GCPTDTRRWHVGRRSACRLAGCTGPSAAFHPRSGQAAARGQPRRRTRRATCWTCRNPDRSARADQSTAQLPAKQAGARNPLSDADDPEPARAIRYLTQVRGVNLAGVKLLLQLRDAPELLREIGEELAAQDEAPAARAAVYQERGDETANDAGRPRPRNRSRRNSVEL